MKIYTQAYKGLKIGRLKILYSKNHKLVVFGNCRIISIFGNHIVSDLVKYE